MAKSQQKLYRFYRSNLATIVWNPEKNKALCEFVDGQYYTEDAQVAQKLADLGYPQIPLDLDEPPDVFFQKGKSLEEGENIPIMSRGVTEDVLLEQEQKRAEQERLIAKSKATSVEGSEPTDSAITSPADIALGREKDKPKTETKVSKPKRAKRSPTKKKAPVKKSEKKPERKVKRRLRKPKKE